MCVCQRAVPKVMFFTGVCQSVGGQQVRSNRATLGEIENKMCFLYHYKETAISKTMKLYFNHALFPDTFGY